MLENEENLNWNNSNSWDKEEILELEQKQMVEEIKRDKKFRIATIVLIVFCILFFIYEIVATIIVKTNNQMPEIQYDINDYINVKNKLKTEYNEIITEELTISKIKTQAQKEVPLFWCIQIDVSYLGDKGGTCSFLIGLIFLNRQSSNSDYTKAIVHERLHLYYYTGCERFIQYQTFRVLYESKNSYFKKVGIEMALEILDDRYPYNYNCTGQIVEYFINK